VQTMFKQRCNEVPCVDGDADIICSANNESFEIADIFCSDRVSFHALNIRCANLLARYKRSCLICIGFCQRTDMEIRFSMASGMFKTKMDTDRHGQRLVPNNYILLYPPYFLLLTTFIWADKSRSDHARVSIV
jgi:hypothetical protein